MSSAIQMGLFMSTRRMVPVDDVPGGALNLHKLAAVNLRPALDGAERRGRPVVRSHQRIHVAPRQEAASLTLSSVLANGALPIASPGQGRREHVYVELSSAPSLPNKMKAAMTHGFSDGSLPERATAFANIRHALERLKWRFADGTAFGPLADCPLSDGTDVKADVRSNARFPTAWLGSHCSVERKGPRTLVPTRGPWIQ